MKYNFHLLEELLHHQLHPNCVLQQVVSPDQLKLWEQMVTLETVKIKNDLKDEVFSMPNSQLAEGYIQFNQREVNSLLKQVLNYTQLDKDLPEELQQLYRNISLELESILNHILRQFTQYFDINQPISPSHQVMAVKDLKTGIEALEKLFGYAAVDPILVKIVTDALQAEVQKERDLTYRQLKFAQEMIDHLLRINEQDANNFIQFFEIIEAQLQEVGLPEQDLTVKMHLTLLYLNFNHPKYITHCITSLWFKMRERTKQNKLDILHLYNKLLNQHNRKPAFAFIPETASAVQQIREWVEVEFSFIMQGRESADGPAIPEPATSASEKMTLGVSASELAVLIEVLKHKDIQFIRDENVAKIFRIFARICITTGSDNLNAAGLRTRAREPRPQAVERIQDLLFKGYDLLRKSKKTAL